MILGINANSKWSIELCTAIRLLCFAQVCRLESRKRLAPSANSSILSNWSQLSKKTSPLADCSARELSPTLQFRHYLVKSQIA